jgi:hypothetical protein
MSQATADFVQRFFEAFGEQRESALRDPAMW